MKAIFIKELIGYFLNDDMVSIHKDQIRHNLRHLTWLAEIKDFSYRYKYDRYFLKKHIDFKLSNSIGSRGIRAMWIVQSGAFYECSYKDSWMSTKREFFTVGNRGDFIFLEEKEFRKKFIESFTSI